LPALSWTFGGAPAAVVLVEITVFAVVAFTAFFAPSAASWGAIVVCSPAAQMEEQSEGHSEGFSKSSASINAPGIVF